MIFVTVGTELPFDRLVKMVDDWGARNARSDVFAQIGAGAYLPKASGYARFLDSQAFAAHLESATVVVSHAGTGSILSALAKAKRLIIVPRRASLGEHRNEHQLATVQHLGTITGIKVAHDETELVAQLENPWDAVTKPIFSPYASISLIEAIREFTSPGKNNSSAAQTVAHNPSAP